MGKTLENRYLMAETLVDLREESGYSRTEAAALMGVSEQALSQWEHGVCNPQITRLPFIARTYGVEVWELFEGADLE